MHQVQEDGRDRLRVQRHTLSLLWPQDPYEGAADHGQEDESSLTKLKVTTSRDPSQRTRRLGKALARFLAVPYVNRGKQGLGDESWIVVVEDHGNPTGFIKRSGELEEMLGFTVSIEPQTRQLKSIRPSVVGTSDDARAVAEFFDLDLLNGSSSPDDIQRYILAAPGHLDFIDGEETIIRLRLRS